MTSPTDSSLLSLDRPAVRSIDPARVFAARAKRLEHLAQTTGSLSGFLRTLAGLADAQAHVFEHLRVAGAAGERAGNALALAEFDFEAGDSGWLAVLESVLARMSSDSEPLGAVLREISAVSSDRLNQLAGAMLEGELDAVPAQFGPFVAAALQVHWALRRENREGLAESKATGTVCPACSSPPVASVLYAGGAMQGARYLVCWLCGTEWNRPRIHCLQCGSSEQVAYFAVEGKSPAVKAEACADCMCYIKVMNQELDTGVDAFADDLATLQLDLMLADEGYSRIGYNPWLIANG